MANVEVKDHPRFGRCAFARRAFVPGDIVLSEEPLLITRDSDAPTPPRHDECMSSILRGGFNECAELRDGSRAAPDLLRLHLDRFLAWADAPAQVQRQVLDDMVHATDFKDSSSAISCEWAAGVIADRLLPRVPGLLPPEVCPPGAARGQQREAVERVLLAWDMNGHGVGGRTALFELGSKLTHTCGAPNTKYQSIDGKGYHVALSHIAPGELLTTSYLGVLDMLLPTPLRRRKLLRGFAFRCRCDRCEAAQDDTRDIPCPRCVPRKQDGRLPADVAIGDVPPAGVLRLHTVDGCERAADVPGTGSSVQPSSLNSFWQCASCSCRLPYNADSAIFGALEDKIDGARQRQQSSSTTFQGAGLEGMGCVEAALCDKVLSFDEQLSSKPVSDWRETCTVLSLMSVGLGAGHYAFNQGLLIHAEVALAELKGALFGLRLTGVGPMAQQALKDVVYYLGEVEDDWRRVWRWLHGRTSVQQLHPGYPVHERMVFDAAALLDARDTLWGALPGARGRQAGARVQEVAAMLVEWVEPIMDTCFRPWQTPEPYSKVEQVRELRNRLAQRPEDMATAAARAGAPGRGQPLFGAIPRGAGGGLTGNPMLDMMLMMGGGMPGGGGGGMDGMLAQMMMRSMMLGPGEEARGGGGGGGVRGVRGGSGGGGGGGAGRGIGGNGGGGAKKGKKKRK